MVISLFLTALVCTITFKGGEWLFSRLVAPTLGITFESGVIAWRNGLRFHEIDLVQHHEVSFIEDRRHAFKVRAGDTNNQQDTVEVIIKTGRSLAIWRRVATISAPDAHEAASQLVHVILLVRDEARKKHQAQQWGRP
ncbi:hypothetical protein QEV83_14445 [Methylocapsa sp. D3K7]|uniref:hypothetical protein n=1 Tax=Methylocapsa sp. D3K7 TaxID=3041435 RepID=UPI00244EAA02|nr:hypothetical protein [Methylocapsa sp. D3K7]WGJ13861.1 hypothetical protein QEV83_14445 [Methylocapsa sp. D3K7]